MKTRQRTRYISRSRAARRILVVILLAGLAGLALIAANASRPVIDISDLP